MKIVLDFDGLKTNSAKKYTDDGFEWLIIFDLILNIVSVSHIWESEDVQVLFFPSLSCASFSKPFWSKQLIYISVSFRAHAHQELNYSMCPWRIHSVREQELSQGLPRQLHCLFSLHQAKVYKHSKIVKRTLCKCRKHKQIFKEGKLSRCVDSPPTWYEFEYTTKESRR